MSSKKKTETKTVNTLPDWLTSPYQAAVTNAGQLAAQPAIGTGTQQAINQAQTNATNFTNTGNAALGSLSGMASGNFGQNSGALTGAANGDFLNSNIFAQNGQPTAVSGALSGFQQNGGLDTGYIDQSLLNQTAAGNFLTPDSNPYIKGVAQQGADAAQARINAQFGAAGRSNGSGLYAQLFGQGIADASNNVYAQNYANERQLQQGAQNALLGSQQAAREAALGRQYGAAGNIFGAENASAENAASRQAQAYEAERARQQAASGGLLNTQLSATSQLPGIMSAITAGNNSALAAGQYQDTAGLNQSQQYAGILSMLGQPFGQQNSTQTQTTSGLGSVLGTIAQLGGAGLGLASGLGAFGGLSSLAGGASGMASGIGSSIASSLPVWK